MLYSSVKGDCEKLDRWESAFKWISEGSVCEKRISGSTLSEFTNELDYFESDGRAYSVSRPFTEYSKPRNNSRINNLFSYASEEKIQLSGCCVGYPKFFISPPDSFSKYCDAKEEKRYIRHLRDDLADVGKCYGVEMSEYTDNVSSNACIVYLIGKYYHGAKYDWCNLCEGKKLMAISPYPFESTEQWEQSMKMRDHENVFRKYSDAAHFVRMWSILQKCMLDDSIKDTLKKWAGRPHVPSGTKKSCWWKKHIYRLPSVVKSENGKEILQFCEEPPNGDKFNQRGFSYMNHPRFECKPKEMWYVCKNYYCTGDKKMVAGYSIDMIDVIDIVDNFIYSGKTNGDKERKIPVFNTDMLFKDYPAAFACLEACADAQLDACRMSLESSVEKKETIEQ